MMLSACSAEGLDNGAAGWDRDASAPLTNTAVDQPTSPEEAIRACYSQEPYVAAPEEAPPAVEPDDGAMGDAACPSEMVLVEGKHCPKVRQTCAEYMEDPIVNPRARCSRFEPSVCKAARVPMR